MISRMWFPWIKRLLGVVAFGVIVWMADWNLLGRLFAQMEILPVVLLLFLSVVLVYVSVLKWHLLLSVFGTPPSRAKLFYLYLLGYFCNTLLPSQIGGDVMRAVAVSRSGMGNKVSFICTFFERFSGLVAMAFLGAISLLIVTELPKSVVVIVALFCCAVVTLLVLIASSMRAKAARYLAALSFVSILLRERIERLSSGVGVLLAQRRVITKTMLLSLLFHSLTVLNTALAAWAIGWVDVPVLRLFVVLPLILLIGAIPLTPNGIGVQEGAFVYFLRMLGATTEEALGVALLLRVKVLILALVGGALWLVRPHSPGSQRGGVQAS